MRSFRIAATPAQWVEDLLLAQGFGCAPEPFSAPDSAAPDSAAPCRRLTAEPFPLGESLAARFGLIYIQDRSSFLAPLSLNPPPGAGVLDMCASPGGKSGFLAALAGPQGFVLANEPSKDRLATLRANLRRLNCAQAATCGLDATKLPLEPGFFPRILLDPPCSGWGTAEKNPKVTTLWHEGKVEPLLALQRALLTKAAELLPPGGTLVYSTCTTNVAENEDQVAWAAYELGLLPDPLSAYAGFVFDEPQRGLRGVLRVNGPASGAQGHFLARLKKPGAIAALDQAPGDLPETGLPGRELDPAALAELGPDCLDWSLLPDGKVFDFGSKAVFVPRAALTLPRALRFQGFVLGKLAKGGSFVPWPGLRVLLGRPDSARDLDLDEVAPLHDLLAGRGLPAAKGPSWAGLYFRGLPLGLVSRKGGRFLLGRV